MNANSIISVKNPDLSLYVKHYFILDFSYLPDEETEFKVPPTGFPVLLFHFGEEGNFYRHKHFTNQSLFIGQCSRHILLYPSRGMKLLGVNFKPYGLFNLLGISPRNFMNSGVESSHLWGAGRVERVIKILNNEGVERGVVEIESLLLEYRNGKVKTQAYFDGLVDQLEVLNGLVDLSDLVEKAVSIRTLQRYFREVIGISPKLFSQVLRHKHIMELLYKNPEMSWSDLQLNGFYYDFAHFSKDFIQFSGLTPKRYLPMKNYFAAALLGQNG